MTFENFIVLANMSKHTYQMGKFKQYNRILTINNY
jgi:hypothetical protein